MKIKSLNLLLTLISVVILLCCISTVTFAAYYPAAKVMVLSEESDVKVEYQGSDAAYTSEVWAISPQRQRIFVGHYSSVGQTINLGRFPAGTELIFGIYVRDTGYTYLNGPGSRNPDGVVHSAIWDVGYQKWMIGFEDLYGGGDRDYNDIAMTITGSAIYILPPGNDMPVANAGSDQTAHPGAIINLDGSKSYDPNNNYPLTFSWTIKQKPQNSQTSLSNPNQINPTMLIDVPGEYTVELVVTDSLGAPSVPSQVKITTSNAPPIADAGPDQSVILIGSTVQLNGGQSWDPEGDPIVYQWSIIEKPLNSNAAIINHAVVNPYFVPDVYGTYRFGLVVSDPWCSSVLDEVNVSFDNIRPVADAGNNQSCVIHNLVSFDGSGSYDQNNDYLTYSWQIISKPANSNAQLIAPNSIKTCIQPDVPGEYIISLIVNDGRTSSEPSNVSLAVISYQDAVTVRLQEAIKGINSLPESVLKNKNMANTLTNKINSVLMSIAAGDYAVALNQLQNDILAKMDGCVNEGVPDKNDWITDATAQGLVYPLISDAIRLLSPLVQ